MSHLFAMECLPLAMAREARLGFFKGRGFHFPSGGLPPLLCSQALNSGCWSHTQMRKQPHSRSWPGEGVLPEGKPCL